VKDLLHKLLGFLRVELEDLEGDVTDLLEISQRKKDNREITNYVYLENKGLLLREIAGIKNLVEGLDGMDTGKFSNRQEMFREIDRRILENTREGDYPEAVYSLVKRRLDKIVKYLFSD
jgi:hypothetical protein